MKETWEKVRDVICTMYPGKKGVHCKIVTEDFGIHEVDADSFLAVETLFSRIEDKSLSYTFGAVTGRGKCVMVHYIKDDGTEGKELYCWRER